MHHLKTTAIAIVIVFSTAISSAHAQSAPTHLMVKPDELKWAPLPSLPCGAQAAVIEGAAFEKLALRSIANIGEFLDRSDPRWQRRQTPWLHRAGVGRLRRCLGDGRTDGGADGREQRKGQSLDPNSRAHGVVSPVSTFWRSRITAAARYSICHQIGRHAVL